MAGLSILVLSSCARPVSTDAPDRRRVIVCQFGTVGSG